MRPKTICALCKNRFIKGSNPDIWYNNFCLASPLPEKIDPVTGKDERELIGQYHEYCNKVNHGDCPLYEPVNVG